MAIAPSSIENAQDMEVVVSGPGDANRLYLYTGMANFYLAGYTAAVGYPAQDSLTFLVGPEFSAGQVKKAIAVGAISAVAGPGPASYDTVSWTVAAAVKSIDADWDDDSAKVRVTAEVAVWGQSELLQGLGFQVTVLASVP